MKALKDDRIAKDVRGTGKHDNGKLFELGDRKYFPYSSGVNDTSLYYKGRAAFLSSIQKESPSMILVKNYSVDKIPMGSTVYADLSRSLKSFSRSREPATPDFTDTDSRFIYTKDT